MSETYDDLIEAGLAGEKITSARLAKARAADDLAVLEKSVTEEDERRKSESALGAALEAADSAAHAWAADRERILTGLRASVLDVAEAAATELRAAYQPVNAARRGLAQVGISEFSADTALPSIGEIIRPWEQVMHELNEVVATFARRNRAAALM